MGEVATIAFLAMIERAARDPAIDVDKLDRLLQMRERENARVAEQAFNAALADAQTEMQPVATDSDNPQTRSRYASYAALDRAVRSVYTAHGFALSFTTEEAPGPEQARIFCDVCHSGGHTRRYRLDMPVDGKGAKGGDVMSRTHAIGSGITYGRRYLLGMIFNLAVCKDDDGNAAGGVNNDRRPRTVVPAPKHSLKQGGISERAIAARVAQAWEPRR
jgi:ERF superfamily